MNLEIQGRTVLVTGSTDGIRKETALQLAHKGAEVILHGRNKEKVLAVQEEIHHRTGNDSLNFILTDLTSQHQVRNLAAEVTDSYDHLNVLINNAGTSRKER